MAEQTGKEMIIKKANALWGDKRTYANRLMLAGSAMLAACFTFLFFGPLEMVAFGIASFEFTYKDVIWLLLSAMLVAFVGGSLAVSALRGKIFNYAVAVIFSVTVAGYLQAALLNGSVGALTGELVEWSTMKVPMVLSCAAWLAVFLVVITVLYFHRAFWRNMVIGVSLTLVVMQSAPLIGILLGAYEETIIPEGPEYYLSDRGIQEYSSDENVFVFILDYMDYDYVEAIYEQAPRYFDLFDGFTGYTNAISAYGRTRPSICNILTGYTDGAYLIRNNEFMQNAWDSQSPNIFDLLKQEDYTVEIYASLQEVFDSGNTAANYVSNLEQIDKSNVTVIPGMMLKKLIYLSAYRYAPMAFKPFFWEYTSFYNEDVMLINGLSQDQFSASLPKQFDGDNSAVCSMLTQGSASRSGKSFKLFHIEGSHPPCYLNRDGAFAGILTDEYEQTWGCLTLMTQVFSRMKELGIYEDATIIMTADHGDASKMWLDDFPGMQTALFYKPAGSAGTPLVWSDAQVSTDNIRATIAKAAGAEYASFGAALDDVGDETVERTFYRPYGPSGDELYLDVYTIRGDAGDISNWILEETLDILHPFY